MTVAGLFVLLWAIMTIARGAWIGEVMRHFMVNWPARILSQATRGHVALVLILIGLGCVVSWYGGADGFRFLAGVSPDVTTFLATFEISAYLDALAAVVLLSSTVRLRAARTHALTKITSIVRRQSGHVRARRAIRLPHIMPANDDEDGPSALTA